MTLTYQLSLEPNALDTYRSLRSDRSDELGKRVRDILARLREDPAPVRAERAATKFSNGLWGLRLEAPDESLWLIVWEEVPPLTIRVHYIGLAPGETPPDAPLYTSESTQIPDQRDHD